MDDIVLIGGGGHCRSVLDSINRIKEYGRIYVVDPGLAVGTEILGATVIGGDDKLQELFDSGVKNALITVGFVDNGSPRSKLYEKARSIGYSFPSIIDPSAVVAENARIGEGVFVGKHSVLNAGCVLGTCSIVNTGAIIEHDSTVGDFSHIATGAIVCGEVKISDEVLIGAGCTVIQCVSVGAHTIIGAGSVVCEDIPEGCKAYGIPARIVERI